MQHCLTSLHSQYLPSASQESWSWNADKEQTACFNTGVLTAQGRITTLKPAGYPSWPTLHLIVLSSMKSTLKLEKKSKQKPPNKTNKSHQEWFYWLNESSYTTGSQKVKEIKWNTSPVWIKEITSRTTLKALK